jgi:hypothetical protein
MDSAIPVRENRSPLRVIQNPGQSAGVLFFRRYEHRISIGKASRRILRADILTREIIAALDLFDWALQFQTHPAINPYKATRDRYLCFKSQTGARFSIKLFFRERCADDASRR